MVDIVILGVDPGTVVTGYGIIRSNGRESEPLDFGSILLPKDATLPDRYRILFESIESLIEEYAPHTVAVETQFVGKNRQSAITLGMARGMIVLAAARKQVSIFEYAPAEAKCAVVGKGNASKSQVQKMVQLLLRIPRCPISEDVADALALALCHAHSLGSA